MTARRYGLNASPTTSDVAASDEGPSPPSAADDSAERIVVPRLPSAAGSAGRGHRWSGAFQFPGEHGCSCAGCDLAGPLVRAGATDARGTGPLRSLAIRRIARRRGRRFGRVRCAATRRARLTSRARRQRPPLSASNDVPVTPQIDIHRATPTSTQLRAHRTTPRRKPVQRLLPLDREGHSARRRAGRPRPSPRNSPTSRGAVAAKRGGRRARPEVARSRISSRTGAGTSITRSMAVRATAIAAIPATNGSSTGATAMALLAFYGAATRIKSGPHQKPLNRGLYYLGRRMLLTEHGGDLQEGTMYCARTVGDCALRGVCDVGRRKPAALCRTCHSLHPLRARQKRRRLAILTRRTRRHDHARLAAHGARKRVAGGNLGAVAGLASGRRVPRQRADRRRRGLRLSHATTIANDLRRRACCAGCTWAGSASTRRCARGVAYLDRDGTVEEPTCTTTITRPR